MTQTFDDKIQAFRNAYTDFIAIANNYPENLQKEAGVCGTWSAHEVIAHINGWLVEAKRRYVRYPRGTGNAVYNDDAFNAVSVWLREDKDFDQLIEELTTLVSDLADMASNVLEAHRERDHRYAEWLTNMVEEAQTHGEQLKQFKDAQS